MTMFSIITCTRNSEQYLPATIKSVLTQQGADYEIVFVDGSSTDNTLALIDNVRCRKQVLLGVTGGISKAMNAGVRAARGDIIAHLHSDDYYAHPRVLEAVARGFADYPDREWLFGRCLSDIDGDVLRESYTVPKYSYSRLLQGNFIPHPATFLRRSAFTKMDGFDESIRYAMDYDLWLRLGKYSMPIQLDEHLAVFRRHAGSLSTANKVAALECDMRVRLKYMSGGILTRFAHYARYGVRWVRAYRAEKASR